MLKIKIFDVDHGNCAYLVAPNGESILVDASHHADGHYPRHEVAADLRARGRQQLSLLVNSNADNDHVTDIHNVHAELQPRQFAKNPTINAQLIRVIKEQPMASGLEALCRVCDSYQGPAETLDLAGVEYHPYWNTFEVAEDTNNASLVSFFFYGGFGIIFPGDLEKKGWLTLLQNPNFVSALSRTKIFVASHHGREGGYCSEVFDHCAPDLVVISDKAIAHDTQDHDLYSQHATGLMFGEELRRVLTTRCDGAIEFTVNPDGSFNCNIGVPRLTRFTPRYLPGNPYYAPRT